jgi:hypothetical protein
MTGKEINSSASGLLVLILPIAFLIVLLFKAWPVLLAVFAISISLRIWQQYQWQQWSKQVNPYFNQLIKENQGCLTALDLSLKANLSAWAARRFLDKKAEEFGGQRREYEGKGTVYYFLTASSLGSIFEDSEEDSEPPLELESEDIASPALKLIEPPTLEEQNLTESQSTTSDATEHLNAPVEELNLPEQSTTKDATESVKAPIEEESGSSVEVAPTIDKVDTDLEPLTLQKPEHEEAPNEKEDSWEHLEDKNKPSFKPLIQAELAKRLDVHSSTVGKRKTDEDFPEWSQSRDPEGIAWEYNPETKEFVPVENPPELE